MKGPINQSLLDINNVSMSCKDEGFYYNYLFHLGDE